ncbi:MAG TPA: response regulator transcription factor [Burkholderiales bacterium]|jgi:two-component system response regulator RegA
MSACRRVLLVDDDSTFCTVLQRALARRGHQVRTAHNVETAMAQAATDPPEWAVVDLKMPGESGLALIAGLRSLAPGMCIVVLTGYASVATAVEAIKLGATHYLAKPVDAEELLAAFQRTSGDTGVPVAERPLSVNRLEWEHIQRILRDHDGNVSATARSLGMHRRTLQRKLAKRPVRD